MLFEKTYLYPKLKLPEMSSEDALVIGSGPSFDDFRLSELKACPATKYGCGQVFQFLHLDHYFLIDYHVANLEGCYLDETIDISTNTIWTLREIEKLCSNRSYGPKMKSLGKDFWISAKGPLATAGSVALNFAIRQNHRRIFLLGIDGCLNKSGVVAKKSHANNMSYKWNEPRPVADTDMKYFKEIFEAKKLFDNLVNLSTCSNFIEILGVSPEVENQKFGIIDKHSSLIAIEWSIAGCLAAKFFRERDKRQAIVLLTSDTNSGSIEDLETKQILTTNLSLQKMSVGFSEVSHLSV